jgi:hypothetical protein
MLPAPPIELGGGWLAAWLVGRPARPARPPSARRPCAPNDRSVLLPARRAPCMARRCMMTMTCLVAASYKQWRSPRAYNL